MHLNLKLWKNITFIRFITTKISLINVIILAEVWCRCCCHISASVTQNLSVDAIQNRFCKISFKLRTTPVYGEVTNSGLSPPHSWPDSPLDSITHISDDTWTPNVDFARRHIFSANISLPDGRITDFQKVTSKEINSVDVCIFRAIFLIVFTEFLI